MIPQGINTETDPNDLLLRQIVGLAMKVHRELGVGFVDSVYGNALALEFSKAELDFEREKKLPLYYGEQIIGDFQADFVIKDSVILDLKAVENLSPDHTIQFVNYLTAARIDTGLLLNFGAQSLQLKSKIREFTKASIIRNIHPISFR